MISAILLIFLACANGFIPSRKLSRPQIISHRGESGYSPEHSLASYQLSIDLRTDYIEPDLCVSKDGVFVAMHDLLLDETTNVASIPEFADRFTTKITNFQTNTTLTGYFVSDFTLIELKSLRLNQRLSSRNQLYNGLLQIPTLDEILDLSLRNYARSGVTTGLYIELKNPKFYASIGFNVMEMLITQLERSELYDKTITDWKVSENVVPVIIQCFDSDALKYLRSRTHLPLVQLIKTWESSEISYPHELQIHPIDLFGRISQTDLVEALCKEVASYADGIGLRKTMYLELNETFIDRSDVNNGLVEPIWKSLRDATKFYGLASHPWTFRIEEVSPQFHDNFDNEMVRIC